MPKNIDELADQSDFDTNSAIADISADLFGQGGESGESGVDSADAGAEGLPEKPSSETTPPPQPEDKTAQAQVPPSSEPGQSPDNTAAVQDVGAPKTWSKEALSEWATLPPRAQQEILKREEDFLKGISMYKGKAEIGEAYDKVVDPYRPILQAGGIDPVQMFSAFASNHYLLTRGTEAQKLELAANMISGYGIDFQKLVHFVGDRMLTPVNPEIQALRAEVQELRQGHNSRQQQEAQVVEQRLAKELEDFANDPANPHFNELAADIQQLFKNGQATTLREAYDKAVYLNPVTREKELDRLTAQRQSSLSAGEQARQTKIAQSTAADLSLDPKPKNGTVPIGSIDDTLAETMAQIASRA